MRLPALAAAAATLIPGTATLSVVPAQGAGCRTSAHCAGQKRIEVPKVAALTSAGRRRHGEHLPAVTGGPAT